MSTRNGSGDTDFAAITSKEMHVWRDKLACISRRLQDELGARMHRHRIPLGKNAGEGQAFDWITETCIETFGASSASLWTVSGPSRELAVQSVRGKGLAKPEHRTPRPDAALRESLAEGKPVIRPSAETADAGMVVPIALGNRTIGVVRVGARTSGEAYADEDLETLRFMVEVAAVCCHLALQEQRVQQAISELGVLSLIAEDSEDVPKAA
jgi:GAF domain-containing protein